MELGPAVVEATHSRVPLVVLTADRPPELRDRGAPQTIDQDHLYGRFAKWFSELPLLDGDPATEAHVRSVAGRAVATALAGPAGPVHLNVPFREPLLPDGSARGRPRPCDLPAAAAVPGLPALDSAALDALAARVAGVERGLIVAGPDDDPALPGALAALARATGFPILADPLSGLRTGPHDRSMVVVARRPARPARAVSRRPRPGARDPDRRDADLQADRGAARGRAARADRPRRRRRLARVGAGAGDLRPRRPGVDRAGPRRPAPARARPTGPGRRAWLRADAAATEAMAGWLGRLEEPFEGAPFACLGDALPDGAVLWAGNSMPVRDLDGWLPSTDRAITVRSNRGANGIDGVVSAALGSAAVAGGPVALVVGDLSFLHDLNALVAAKLHDLSATIVLVNNDGGGIFSFLPQAHGVDPGLRPAGPVRGAVRDAARDRPRADRDGAGRRAPRRSGPAISGPQVDRSIGCPGVQVLELRTDRARNVALHREVAALVAEAIRP